MTTPQIHTETLPNGLTLLAREMHGAPVVNLQIWVRVGSADERPGEEGLDLEGLLTQLETQLLKDALNRTGGNRTEAAKKIGVSRRTLHRKDHPGVRNHRAAEASLSHRSAKNLDSHG